MLKRGLMALIGALAVILGGCASHQVKPPIQIKYEAAKPDPTGLMRVFVLSNGNTVLQFQDVSKSDPKIFENGKKTPTTYQVVGQQMIVLKGTPASVSIEALGKITTINLNRKPVATQATKK